MDDRNGANSNKTRNTIHESEYQINANKINVKPKSKNKSQGIDEG